MMLRRFQFRLRTLLIGVTLLAVPCAYVGWQAKIIRDRKALIKEIESLNGFTLVRNDDPRTRILSTSLLHDAFRAPITPNVNLHPIRRWLGDTSINYVVLPRGTMPEQISRFQEAFREASFAWK